MHRATIATIRIVRPKPEFVGPYCRWPRRGVKRFHREFAVARTGSRAEAHHAHGVLPSN